ncbi:MAG: hypothetical protein QNK05_01635 [Myxococcota bacterium]|nr:hypothetical protein [Myxococcota bacterium]
MSSEKPLDRPPGSKRPMVRDASGERPFMRGILVHSLMARGASFDEAYRAAGEVRERIRGREVVERADLARYVEELFAKGRLERPLPLPETIVVVAESGSEAPFSKGVLSQSFLAAAVDPNDAFDVARAIEADLVSRGVKQVGRSELRRLAHDQLAQRLGERPSERYRVWRRFVASERPLVLLLGGAPGVGKSTLAQEVAHRLGISRASSTDAIRQVMRLMLSPELVPAIHASSYDAHQHLTPPADDEEAVVAGFRAQAGTVCVGARAMVERAVQENTSVILDGVSVVPGLLDLESLGGDPHVIFLMLANLDAETFRNRFETRARSASQREPHRYVSNLDAILQIQDHLLELAEHHEVPIVENRSFDSSVASILRHVSESLRQTGAPTA